MAGVVSIVNPRAQQEYCVLTGFRNDCFPCNASGEMKEIVSGFVCKNSGRRAMQRVLLSEHF